MLSLPLSLSAKYYPSISSIELYLRSLSPSPLSPTTELSSQIAQPFPSLRSPFPSLFETLESPFPPAPIPLPLSLTSKAIGLEPSPLLALPLSLTSKPIALPLSPKRNPQTRLAANSASSEKVRVNQNLKLLKALDNHERLMVNLQELQACTNEYMKKQLQLRQERAELLQKFNECELKLLCQQAEFDKLNKEKEELMAMQAMAEVQNMQDLDEIEQFFATEQQ